MSVVSKISVGDIFYYVVDAVPTHSAPKGSVSILHYENTTTMYINNDSSTTWLKTIVPAFGEMYINNNTTLLEWNNYTASLFYSFESTNPWVSDVMDGFVKDTNPTFGDNIQYTGDTKIRACVQAKSTTRGGDRWMEFEHVSTYNFSAPIGRRNGFHTLGGDSTGGFASVAIQEMNKNDQLTLAFSPIRRQVGGGPNFRRFINRHGQLSAYKVDEGRDELLFKEDWESGDFTQNSWSVVNASTNVWVVGQADNNTVGGTSSAYISNDGGTSAAYTINIANISHFYKDFTIPIDSPTLSFDWKCNAENAAGATQYDYGTVVITTTGTTPVVGSEVITTQTDGAVTTRIGATTNLGKFNLAYGTNPATTWNTETIDLSAYVGQTKRFVFTWVNDASVGTNPPFTVDNIEFKGTNWD